MGPRGGGSGLEGRGSITMTPLSRGNTSQKHHLPSSRKAGLSQNLNFPQISPGCLLPPPCNIQSRLWSRATPASVSDAAAAHTLRVPSALGRPLCSSLSEASSCPFLPPVNGARLPKDRQLPAQGLTAPNQPFSVLLIHLPHEPKTSGQLKAKPHEAEAERA